MFLADIGHHRSDPRPGGVQGDRRCALGRGIVGVPQQPLQHRSHDAGGRPALPHHHCHDAGTQTAAPGPRSPVGGAFLLLDSDLVFVSADQQDRRHEALRNR